jgi:predicted house-cleaning noncanonical NTP pyrophosphatase (MazG superfamily)
MSSSRYAGHKVWRKLVRDGIPEIISRAGAVAVTKILDDEEFERALKTKLLEEAAEVSAATATEIIDELCDVLEVVQALAALSNVTPERLEKLRELKASERGSFASRTWLDETYPLVGGGDRRT